MEVILLEKVGKLGGIGDKVNVKAGYGRNFLIPEGKAVSATKHQIEKFELRRAELMKLASEQLDAAQKRGEKLAAMNIVIATKVGEEGKLYGSIGTKDIADAFSQAGEKVNKSEVKLPNGVIRLSGEHEIDLQIHSDVMIKVTVNVVPENNRT